LPWIAGVFAADNLPSPAFLGSVVNGELQTNQLAPIADAGDRVSMQAKCAGKVAIEAVVVKK
jgi:hypothetical protein